MQSLLRWTFPAFIGHFTRQFTDLLLLCSARLIPNRVIGVGSGLPPYRVRARFNVALVEVLEGDNLETANTFYLREGAKTVELYTGTQEEKEAWIDALFAAMTELTRRKSSLRISPVHQQQQHVQLSPTIDLAGLDLGKTAPTLVKMDTVTRCAQCQGQFSVMKRKHHCYSCGKVPADTVVSLEMPGLINAWFAFLEGDMQPLLQPQDATSLRRLEGAPGVRLVP